MLGNEFAARRRLGRIVRFSRDESGAATADWVVITGLVVAVGALVVLNVSSGTSAAATSINEDVGRGVGMAIAAERDDRGGAPQGQAGGQAGSWTGGGYSDPYAGGGGYSDPWAAGGSAPQGQPGPVPAGDGASAADRADAAVPDRPEAPPSVPPAADEPEPSPAASAPAASDRDDNRAARQGGNGGGNRDDERDEDRQDDRDDERDEERDRPAAAEPERCGLGNGNASDRANARASDRAHQTPAAGCRDPRA